MQHVFTEPASTLVPLALPEQVLERLIASGALCAAEVHCESQTAKCRLMGICKRCCAQTL